VSLNSSESNGSNNDAEKKFKDEIVSLNQTWDQIFLVWDKLEEAMIVESVTYNQLEPAINQTIAICNAAFTSIERSIENKTGV
jgi:hypothetical protein